MDDDDVVDEVAELPGGVEVYRFGADGDCTVTDGAGTRPPGTDEELLRSSTTGSRRTAVSTFRAQLRHASCGLFDERRDTAVDPRLTPGTLVRSPAMVPHSSGNRAGTPLLILAANTGSGIDHEDYAIAAAEAGRHGGAREGVAGAGGTHPGPDHDVA